ncbi:MAG: hypothetical protein KBD01_16375 [Acidobacteria bacterium]|nr:hypothetical protein [Acidobacteriota bacterium]
MNMFRSRTTARLFAALIVLGALSAGAATAQTALRFKVKARGMSFLPGELNLVQGDTVRWKFKGQHSSTSGTCAGNTCTPDGTWDSGVKASGSFSRLFDQAGDFPYYCTVHGAMMQGVVHVFSAPPPDGAPLLLAVAQRGRSKLDLSGANFGAGASVEINGVPAPATVRRSDRALLAKGKGLRDLLPAGVPVQVTVRNADGQVSAALAFTPLGGSSGTSGGGSGGGY